MRASHMAFSRCFVRTCIPGGGFAQIRSRLDECIKHSMKTKGVGGYADEPKCQSHELRAVSVTTPIPRQQYPDLPVVRRGLS